MPDLERILQNTPGSIAQQWYESGAPVDPGTVTVGITRWDGTVLVAAGTGTTGTGANARVFNLTTTHTALLDRLTVTWTSSAKGTLVSYLEVAGGFLFDVADLRANPALSNTTTYPTSTLVAMRTTVEQALEQACARAFVPRYQRETLSGDGTGLLTLKYPDLRLVRAVSVAGAAYAAGDVANVAFNPSGILYTPLLWTSGYSNVTVGYEHGMDYTPPEVSQAALLLAKMKLVGQRNPIDDRAVTFSTTEGGTYSLAVPGRNESTFGQPDIDAIVDRYSMAVGVA